MNQGTIQKLLDLAKELDRTDCTSETYKEAFEGAQKMAREALADKPDEFFSDSGTSYKTKKDLLQEILNYGGFDGDSADLESFGKLLTDEDCQNFVDGEAENAQEAMDDKFWNYMEEFADHFIKEILGDSAKECESTDQLDQLIKKKLLAKKIDKIVTE